MKLWGRVNSPPVVLTTTSTRPVVECDGVVQVICVSLIAGQVAALPPIVIVPPSRFVPTMDTVVPPDVAPVDGVMLVMVGGGEKYIKVMGADVPPIVVTVTFTFSGMRWVGQVHLISVAELLVMGQSSPPNLTLVAPERREPLIVTDPCTVLRPDVGLMPLITGTPI